MAAQGTITAWRSGLRSLEASRASLKAQGAVAPIVFACGVTGAVLAGGPGGATGMAIGAALGSLVWRTLFHREAARRP